MHGRDTEVQQDPAEFTATALVERTFDPLQDIVDGVEVVEARVEGMEPVREVCKPEGRLLVGGKVPVHPDHMKSGVLGEKAGGVASESEGAVDDHGSLTVGDRAKQFDGAFEEDGDVF